MAIGIDIDDVLCDTVASLVPVCNSHFGAYHTRDEFKTYQISDVYGCTRAEGLQLYYDFLQTPKGAAMPPVDGSVEGIKALSTIDDLIVITSRHERFRRETEEWLDLHYPGMFSAVHMNHNPDTTDNRYDKSIVAVDTGITLLLEDQIHHAESCARAGIPILLLDTPWNQVEYDVFPHILMTRVYSWPEIVVRVYTNNLT
ncbi:MAG: hypothetical protein V1729_05520 [Candidatus Woesearchaeota archaeon]